MEIAGDEIEMLAEAAGTGDLAAVQFRPRRCRRLQHAEGRHVDTEDGLAHRVFTQVVSERFDLG